MWCCGVVVVGGKRVVCVVVFKQVGGFVVVEGKVLLLWRKGVWLWNLLFFVGFVVGVIKQVCVVVVLLLERIDQLHHTHHTTTATESILGRFLQHHPEETDLDLQRARTRTAHFRSPHHRC